MSGTLEDLSKEQSSKLDKLRDNTKDIRTEKHDDRHLLRFLRARNFSVKKSEEMFRKDVEYRKVNKIDTMIQDYNLPEAVEKYWVGGVCGVDKQGHNVHVIPLGNVDPRGLIYSIKSSERKQIGMYLIEEIYYAAKQNSKKQGRCVEGTVFIIDLENLGAHVLWKPFIALWNDMMQIMEQHYPETVKSVYLVRTPAIFPVAYSLVRPFLHENTRKKIKILKTKTMKETLLKYIDADQIPVHWGGEQTDPDGNPKCPSKIRLGGKIPESYYIKDQLLDEETLTKLNIGKGSSKEITYPIHVQESVLRFVFKTEEGEIIFSIYKLTKDKKKEIIREPEKLICHITPADGEVEFKEVGNYVLRFENPSKLKSKTLSYQVDVLEPDEETLESAELEETE